MTPESETSPTGVPAAVYRLEDWSLGYYPSARQNPYLADEQRARVLQGDVYGSPAYADGHPVRTSAVVSARGNLVVTQSGSIYQLGTPDPKYVAWVTEEFGAWDAENPVRIVTASDPDSDPVG